MEVGRKKRICLAMLALCSHWQLKPALALSKLYRLVGGFKSTAQIKCLGVLNLIGKRCNVTAVKMENCVKLTESMFLNFLCGPNPLL